MEQGADSCKGYDLMRRDWKKKGEGRGQSPPCLVPQTAPPSPHWPSHSLGLEDVKGGPQDGMVF